LNIYTGGIGWRREKENKGQLGIGPIGKNFI